MQDSNPRDIPLGYLRTFLVVLVVLHHAVIAYCQFAPPPAHSLTAQPLLWTAFPIVDAHRWGLADLIVGFNDTFFMSLMFLIAGVFTWTSLTRKGASRFIGDRARRLGIPFVIGAGLLTPLAYYPSWLQSATQAGPFWKQWLAIGVWPAGPAWFLWVLLAFSLIAAIAYRFAMGAGDAIARAVQRLGERPILAFVVLASVSVCAYVPMAATFDPSTWKSFGPFFVQISRVPHYFLYFAFGTGLGAAGLSRGLLQPKGRLARRWLLWCVAAFIAFVVATGAVIAMVSAAMHGHPNAALATFCNAMFPITCATISFACIAVFLRFATKARRAFDSLSANAYGIYLLHYACVTWLQYALLRVELPGAAKAMLVFGGALAASWGLSVALRRIPAVARYV